MAADHDRLAEAAELAQQLAELNARARVQTGRRFVKEQHLGVVDEGVGEAQALLHAAREAADVRLALGREIDQLQQVADHALSLGGSKAVAPTEEVQVLPDLHVVVDPKGVGHVAEDAPNRLGVPTDRFAGHRCVPGRGHEQRREHPEHRRLARPVRSDETEDLAFLDREIHAANRERAVVALEEPGRLDNCGHSTTPTRASWKVKPALPSGLSFTNRTRSWPVAGST